MFSLFYQIGIHALACAQLPKLVFQYGKYKQLLAKRLGKGFPNVQKGSKKLVWVHAVSLGETKAVAPLIIQLKKENPQLCVILSTVTQTGHQEGLKNIPQADFHVFLPFDLPYIIRPIIKKVSPDVVIITETDFWYNFQQAAKNQGAHVIVVNGKLSERSSKRYRALPVLRGLLNPIDFFCVQGELYKKRFEHIGISSKKVLNTGNLKFDGLSQTLSSEELSQFKKKLNIQTGDFVLTLGSTHDPEEWLLLKTLKVLWEKFPQWKILLVPRHPERFNAVAKILQEENIEFQRLSQGVQSKCQVVLMDAMGLLRNCYQISHLAFVGGSLTTKVGGHNILEPSFYGVPVLFGPHMYGQPDFLDLMRHYKAGVQIEEATLIPQLQELLSSATLRQQMGSQGLKLVADAKGSLNRTLEVIRNYLE